MQSDIIPNTNTKLHFREVARERHTFKCIAAVIKHASRRALLVQLPQNWIIKDTILSKNFISITLGVPGSKHADSADIFAESAEHFIVLLCRK
uniref:Uncharacterized protein n=1 Tax=Arundo donax TaxID=35708 RepID=A0A0A9FHB3_ARUDO